MHFPESLKSIGYCAFKSCHGLQSVVFEGNVDTLGEQAFASCSNLTNIIIKGEMGELKKRQFTGLQQIRNVYCYSTNPPEANDETFEYSPIESAMLHVPEVAIETYRESPGWKAFGNIVKIEGNPNGIETVQSPESIVHSPNQGIFNLLGRRLHVAPEKGIYIQDGKKVLVK